MIVFQPISDWPHFRETTAAQLYRQTSVGLKERAGDNAGVLEISSRSRSALGRALSAMSLRDPESGKPVEVVYQASKSYGAGRSAAIRQAANGFDAKRLARERHERHRQEGVELTGFELLGHIWPAATGTAAYDLLWCRAAVAARGGAKRVLGELRRYAGFSDQFHRAGSMACQARSAAMLASLLAETRGIDPDALASPEQWLAWRLKTTAENNRGSHTEGH